MARIASVVAMVAVMLLGHAPQQVWASPSAKPAPAKPRPDDLAVVMDFLDRCNGRPKEHGCLAKNLAEMRQELDACPEGDDEHYGCLTAARSKEIAEVERQEFLDGPISDPLGGNEAYKLHYRAQELVDVSDRIVAAIFVGETDDPNFWCLACAGELRIAYFAVDPVSAAHANEYPIRPRKLKRIASIKSVEIGMDAHGRAGFWRVFHSAYVTPRLLIENGWSIQGFCGGSVTYFSLKKSGPVELKSLSSSREYKC